VFEIVVDVRREQPDTKAWHYVDIPMGGKYDAGRDCALPDSCVVLKINDFFKVLTDKNAKRDEPSVSGAGDAAEDSLGRPDSRSTADRTRSDSAPLPHQAAVLGLHRTGSRDAQQRRLPVQEWRAATVEEEASTCGLNVNHIRPRCYGIQVIVA